MSKLSFISLMRAYAWGGSEELWQKTALLAAKQNHVVAAHMSDLAIGHPKAIELSQAGIFTGFRKERLTLQDRVIRKFRLQQHNKSDIVNYWKINLKETDDLYVISGGNTFDCLHYPELFEKLHKENSAYVYISQHHYEHGAIDKYYRDLNVTIFEKAKKIFFVSQRNLDVVQMQLGKVFENAEVIFNPINLPGATYIKNPYTADQSLHAACVARLECANKGQDILLKALATEKWLNRDIHFSFYGKGPDEEYLTRLAAHLGLQHKVSFCGHVNNIQDIWKSNHVLLMSSLAEGTPLSLMEAMACGRSAVLTDVGGNAEWITDGYNGFIAEGPAPASLDAALEKMWQQREALPAMGRRCYETFINKYPDDAIAYLFDKLKALLPAAE